MMVANTKMELSELTRITKNRYLMIETKAEPTKHSIEQSKVNRNSKMIVVNSDTCQVNFQKTKKCGHKSTTWAHRRHAYVLETEVHNKHGKFLLNFKHSRFNNKPHLPQMPRKTVKADKKDAAKAPPGTVQHLIIYILTITGIVKQTRSRVAEKASPEVPKRTLGGRKLGTFFPQQPI